jgi:hypothetical protein
MSIGGIDSQVRNLVDANRGNPNALMQQQKLNPDTLNLLALEKLKREKDIAAKHLQASMPNQQGTIADQRMAEALENTKKEMQGGIKDVAARVGGVGKQQAARQQQNMQKVAQQGVATQPAPNMARMAGGGIVAFADGSLVNAQNLTEEQTRFLRSQGFSAAQVASMTPDKLNDVLLGMRTFAAPPMNEREQALRRLSSTPRQRMLEGMKPPTAAQKQRVGIPNIVPTGSVPPNVVAERQNAEQQRQHILGTGGGGVDQMPASSIPPSLSAGQYSGINRVLPASSVPTAQPRGGLGGDLSSLHNLLGPKQAPAGQATTGVGSLLQDRQKATDARGDAVDWAGGVLNREGHAAQRADMLRRLQEANTAAAAKRKRDRWMDISAGAGGRGAGSNMARQAYKVRQQEAALDDAALRSELGLEESNIKGAVEIAEAQVTAGTAASKAALEKSARDTLNSIKRKQVAATSAAEKEKLFVDITKAIAKIKQENSADVEKRISENVNMIAIRQAAMKGDTEAIAKVEAFEKKAREEAYTEVSATLIELERLRESVSRQLGGWGRPNESQKQPQPQKQPRRQEHR